MATTSEPLKALLFDMFGTCVNWRDTVTNALAMQAHAALNAATASMATSVRLKASSMTLELWGGFAQQWRDTYKQFTKSLAEDPALPWKTVDEHHFDALNELLAQHGLEGLWSEEDVRALSLIWHKLEAWPDSSPGIAALNKSFFTATLSNGNLSLLNDLKMHGQLGFTHVFSAETFGFYKPSPKVYLGAVAKLDLKPQECGMVAAHLGDLKAARASGLRVFYVERPLEEDWDREQVDEARREGWVDGWITLDQNGFAGLAKYLEEHVTR
ncbi:haloacid dehalogenase [Delitschia confertaspora ATCC 74209]|uniref:Haloacid dehalogenase n=1 Tax=Delitschia confertaspora ATCC 74209 TaxID=1513339 RepID=A0A9P4JFD3_9PLEO|nr:haloacid dehalogenase [Delitschia confertaspora ATCC 74209]